MVTRNVLLDHGVVNGATGIVEGVLFNPKDDAEIQAVLVRLDDFGTLVKVTRTLFEVFHRGQEKFIKRGFPLTLAYAMTGMGFDDVVS